MKKILVLITLMLLLGGCSDIYDNPVSGSSFVEKQTYALGTLITIKLYDTEDESIIDKAFDRIVEIENRVSVNIDSSNVWLLNNSPANTWISVDEDTMNIVKSAYEYSAIEGSSFDLTVLPLVELWGIGTDNAKLPSVNEIEVVLPLIDYKNVVIDEENSLVMLLNDDTSIDLGSIAKGYIADEVKKVLIDNGVTSALINLGGNVLAVGNKTDNTNFNIGIQDPYDDRYDYVGIIGLNDVSSVTSGIYERYVEVEGVRYHHILDTKTGFPIDNNLASVTIISDYSIDGDALSTTVFTMGLVEGYNFINNLDNTEAIFVTTDKDIILTSGLLNNFVLSNSSYTVIEK